MIAKLTRIREPWRGCARPGFEMSGLFTCAFVDIPRHGQACEPMRPRAGRRILKGNVGAARLIFVSDSQEIDAVRFSSDEQMLLEKLRKISRRRSDHYIFRVRRHPEARDRTF